MVSRPPKLRSQVAGSGLLEEVPVKLSKLDVPAVFAGSSSIIVLTPAESRKGLKFRVAWQSAGSVTALVRQGGDFTIRL